MIELNLNIEALQLSISGGSPSHYRLTKNYVIRDFDNARVNLIRETNKETKERTIETFECPVIFLYDTKYKKEAVFIKRKTLSQIVYAIYDYNPKTDLVIQSSNLC